MFIASRPMMLIVCLALCGCTEPPESDVIGPRATSFRSGATFAVCAVDNVPGPTTVDREDPTSGEVLHLKQPPIVTLSDIEDMTVMEAPGQWPVVTLTFSASAAKRLPTDAQVAGGMVAVLISDKVFFTATLSGKPVPKMAISSVIGGPDIREFIR